MKTTLPLLAAAGLTLLLGQTASAQQYQPNAYYQPNLYNNPNQAYQLNNYYYYPYYYFPQSYLPALGPRWPEAPGEPVMMPPPWMAYPASSQPNLRYDLLQPAKYYHGFHFWLDSF